MRTSSYSHDTNSLSIGYMPGPTREERVAQVAESLRGAIEAMPEGSTIIIQREDPDRWVDARLYTVTFPNRARKRETPWAWFRRAML